jgi:hypothetical protein
MCVFERKEIIIIQLDQTLFTDTDGKNINTKYKYKIKFDQGWG